jgi:hypothetical protein
MYFLHSCCWEEGTLPNFRDFTLEPAESKYAAMFQQLVGIPRIRELIARLGHSENERIRQAALLAIRGRRDRLLQ